MAKPEARYQIEDIKQNTKLWYKVRVLLFDLRHFDERPASRDRLELVIDSSYIGAPYFDTSEIKILKSLATDESGQTLSSRIQATLDQKLNRRKRIEDHDYRPCAAHDLAPIFERSLGIRPKDLQRDKSFIKALEKNGLDFREEVEGAKVTKAKSEGRNQGNQNEIQGKAALI